MEEVKQTINNLFDGMRNSDSSLVSSSLHHNASFVTSYSKENEFKAFFESPQKFLEAIGTPHDGIYDERINGLTIEIDNGLAQAWMNYEFYLDEEFSHCGVNAMQLIKVANEWKIVHLADTRRKLNCNED